jgi:transcriptional regulator with XRE-family HTH domain
MKDFLFNSSISDIMRSRRERLGLSMEKLAEELGTSVHGIRMIEAGFARLTVGRALKLASLLELDETFLMERTLNERRELAALHTWLFGPAGRLRQGASAGRDCRR